MSDLQIAWLELILIGGILVFVGFIRMKMTNQQNRWCTKETNGIVIRYDFPGKGRMVPIVEYVVEGKCYQANHPKICYVDQPVSETTWTILIFVGIGTFILSIVGFYLIQI